MVRFIFSCMMIVPLSFMVVPIYFGVSAERQIILKKSVNLEKTDPSLSFEEIYDIANKSEFDQGFDPQSLNKIKGPNRNNQVSKKSFALGFRSIEIPALPEATQHVKNL